MFVQLRISLPRIKLTVSKILHGGSLASWAGSPDANEPPCKIFDVASFILAGEIVQTRTKLLKNKQPPVTDISTFCISACVYNNGDIYGAVITASHFNSSPGSFDEC